METFKEAAEKFFNKQDELGYSFDSKESFIEGAKWQQEQDKKMYSDEDIMFAYEQGARLTLISQSSLALHKGEFPTPKEWFKQFKNK